MPMRYDLGRQKYFSLPFLSVGYFVFQAVLFCLAFPPTFLLSRYHEFDPSFLRRQTRKVMMEKQYMYLAPSSQYIMDNI